MVVDYAIPVAFHPLGAVVGEGASQIIEEGLNYMEDNFR